MTRTVVLAHGDRRQLRAALDRARRHGHELHVVAAVPSATRGLRTHRSPLVTVHDEPGRAGLERALASAADDELVLLLHDDVLLDPDAAVALLAAVDEPRLVAIPSTNHEDVDGGIGSLPPDVVQPLRAVAPVVPVERFRTACFATSAGRVRELLHKRLTSAPTSIHLPDGTVRHVPHVVATHLDDCRDRLEAPASPDERPLLVASMIVRDEEEFLPGCLASLEGLVDRIDICDTGSVDRTVEIAREAGARVITTEWHDDFARARNEALELSRDAHWVLQIDADERARVSDPTTFRAFLATALADPGAFDVPLRDIDEDGNEVGGLQLPRIFPGRGTTYIGRIHEVPHSTDGQPLPWTVSSHLQLDHLGYQREVLAGRDKLARNLALARRAHAEEPSATTGLQVARSLRDADEDVPERIELLTAVLDAIHDDTDGMNETGRTLVYELLTRALTAAGHTDEAWAVIEEGRRAYPHVSVLRAMHARLGADTGRYEDVVTAGITEVGDAQRLVVNPLADATRLVELARSQLAIDDVAGAGRAVVELLEGGVPPTLDRWNEIVPIAALTVPDRVVELLAPAASSDVTGRCILAVGATFDPPDAAAFAVDVVSGLGGGSDEQNAAAVRLCLIADRADLLAQLVELLGLDRAALRAEAPAAGARVAAYLDGSTAPVPIAEASDAVAQIVEALHAGHDVDPSEMARVLARDPSGNGLSTIAQLLQSDDAATLAALTVQAAVDDLGTAPDDIIRTTLAIVAMSQNASAARAVVPHLGRQDPAMIESLVRRTVDRGATAVSSALARALFPGPATPVAASSPPLPPIIRVLGMHRSSTSAYAHVLRALGVDAGPEDELIPAAPDNPRGFHEHRPLVLAADSILARLGGTWDAPPSRADMRSELATALTAGSVATLERLAADRSGPLLWKDPRLCLLLDTLDRALADRAAVTDLHVMRPPDEVTASLQRRNGLHPEHAARLWVRYVADALAARPDASVFLSDQLFSDAGATVERLAQVTGLRPDDAARAAACGLIDEGLQVRSVLDPDPGPWLVLARTMHASATDGDLRAAAEAGLARLQDDPVAPYGLPLVVPRSVAGLATLGRTSAPVAVVLAEQEPAASYSAASLGYTPVVGAPADLIGALRPSAVWIEERDALQTTAMSLTIHAPRTPLASAVATDIADANVMASDAVRFVTSAVPGPPTPSSIPALPSCNERAGVTSVVIPVFGKWELTSACLDSLHAMDDGPLEIIVVDDASPDDTVVRATGDSRIDRLVSLPDNRGFPGAVNAGLAVATGEYVCILNNDTEVTPGWLSAMRRELDLDGVAMVGPRSNSISGPQAVPGAPPVMNSLRRVRSWGSRYLDAAAPRSWPLDRLVGFCLLVRRDLLAEVGGLDEGVGRGNFEDDELCARLSPHGTLRAVDDSLVLHLGSATFGGGDGWRRAMLVGARHVHDRLSSQISSTRGVVLSDGNLEMTMRSVVAIAGLATSVTVVERAGADATRRAVGRLPRRIEVIAADWVQPAGTWADLVGHDDRRIVVLLAGEEFVVRDRADALLAIETAEAGQLPGTTGVRVVRGNELIDLDRLATGDGAPLAGLASS